MFGKDSVLSKMAKKFSKTSVFSKVVDSIDPELGPESKATKSKTSKNKERYAGVADPENQQRVDEMNSWNERYGKPKGGADKESVFTDDQEPTPVIISSLSPEAIRTFEDIRDKKDAVRLSKERKDDSKDSDDKKKGILGGLLDGFMAKFSSGLAGAASGILKAAAPIAGIAAAGAAGWMLGRAIDQKFGISDKVASLTGGFIDKRDAKNNLKKHLEEYKGAGGRTGEVFRQKWALLKGDEESDPILKSKTMDNAWDQTIKQIQRENKKTDGAPSTESGVAGSVDDSTSHVKPDGEMPNPPEVANSTESFLSASAGGEVASVIPESNPELSAISESSNKTAAAVGSVSAGVAEMVKKQDAVISALMEGNAKKTNTNISVGGGMGGGVGSARDNSAYDAAYEVRSRYWTSYTRGF